ncbi:Aste57867_23338 [Aphanomyces stellatus]|uniref:Aste57867_23338 protein n=1 Tax=Aphanomyces stellatus TaxID=120398 RepID=A0A485LMI1_9STRA|nr:hypothetical protein As57867_023267 [Aphanomyces stellatus]VFT99983.1 Aste57867_23338 [Aphanomyces stellatus]
MTRQDLQRHVVFLRFESASPHQLHQRAQREAGPLNVGDHIRCDSMVDDVQSREHPTRAWVQAHDYVLEEATGLASCECNNLGWYLSTTSASHVVLAAYLFYRVDHTNEPTLVVLSRAASPVFAVHHSQTRSANLENESPNRLYPIPLLRRSVVAPFEIEWTLAILHAFLMRTPPTLHHIQHMEAMARVSIVRPRLASTIHYDDRTFSFPSIFFATAVASHASSCTKPAGLASIASAALCSLYEAPFTQQLTSLCATHATSSLLDKTRLRQLYDAYRQAYAAHMDAWLQSNAGMLTHTTLAQALVTADSLVPGHLAFGSPDAAVQNSFEWFVAQLRECFLAISLPPQFTQATSSVFDGAWLYHATNNMQTSVHLPSCHFAPIRWLTTAFAFQMRWDGHTLYIRSDLATHVGQWTELVLDRHPRVCRVLPNGETTMRDWSGAWLHGDYVGNVGHNPTTLALTFFSWPLTATSLAYRLQVDLQVCQDRHTPSLVLRWGLSSFAMPRHRVDVWGLSATERHEKWTHDTGQMLASDARPHFHN